MIEQMQALDLGEAGPTRDLLVAHVLGGRKSATSTLRVFYDMEGAVLPQLGERRRVIDSAGEDQATVEITDVTIERLADVDDSVPNAVGEDFSTADDWRAAHVAFWDQYREEVRAFLARPEWAIDDDTEVVITYFRLA